MSGSKLTKEDTENLGWRIIESYFKNQYLNRLVRHQIESYNYFINSQIQNTIQMFNPVNIKSPKDEFSLIMSLTSILKNVFKSLFRVSFIITFI